VLHYGGVPKVDLATWDFTMDGLIEQPVRLTRDQLLALPRREVKADVHMRDPLVACSTASTWRGCRLPRS